MAVPTAITDLSATAASNAPAGSEAVFPNGDDYFRAAFAFIRQGDTKASDIASASTVDLGAAVGRIVDVTGTTTITSFGTVAAGIWRVVRFTGALTLTHNATSLILPGGANITTAAGDCLLAVSLGSGNWVVTHYQPKAGYTTKTYVDAAVSPLAPKASPTFTGAAGFADGTNSAPSITFSSDTDTGLYRSGANTLDLVTGGATRWRVDSSGRLRNTSNTQPGFAATRSANQTSGTTIICDSEARDIGSAYDNSTGVFTAPVDGAYLLAFAVSVYNQTGSAASVQTSMTGGGATIVSSDTAANTSRGSTSGTAVLYLTSGDTVSLTITSLSANLYVLPGSSFSGVLLG